MVWFHGGGNLAGAASDSIFDGESLARHGVLLVTAQYRLGVFGFFAHPELTRESPHHVSGNYGLLDQVAAPIRNRNGSVGATDSQFRCGTVAELVWHTTAGNPGYQFQFARAAPGREAAGAAHGSEVP